MSMIMMAVLMAALVQPLDHNVVSTAWLEQNLSSPDVVVVEVTDTPEVDHPHIPNAHFVAMKSLLSGEGWPPDEMASIEQMRRTFEDAGIGDSGRIILYSSNPLYATRAWLTLDYLGQADRVSILDGGYQRWAAEHRPLANKRTPHLSATFTPRPDPDRIVTLAEMQLAMNDGTRILDARNAYEFHGFRRGHDVARRGHIPNASCDPWQSNVHRDNSFLAPDELRAKYEKLLGKPDAKPVIVYCRTGMEASLPYFVLRSLGYDVRLYDGSYAEWSRDKVLPVAKLSSRP